MLVLLIDLSICGKPLLPSRPSLAEQASLAGICQLAKRRHLCCVEKIVKLSFLNMLY